MEVIVFFWDDRKNERNREKHAISFEEAQTVFFDDNAVEFYDPDHSATEDRFLMLGLSYKLRILVVSYTVRNDTEIRIISARKAVKKEKEAYRERL